MTVHEMILDDLDSFDKNASIIIRSEDEIVSIIRKNIPDNAVLDDYSQAELTAFFLIENSDYGKKFWKTYFGTPAEKISEDQYHEYIKLSSITDTIIEYWERRARSCRHPVLVARYTGLVWVFKGKVTPQKPDPRTIGREYISSLIRCVRERRYTYTPT